MANPIYKSYTTTGTKEACALNFRSGPTNISVAVVVPGGTTASYSVQYTFDDLSFTDVSAADWITDPQFPLASSATLVGNYIAPIAGLRVVIATLTGGPIRLKVLQGDGGR
ncbi:hypothetical protein [Chelatococcus sp.]|uniref:hypothetical protein n=1 Tax=Chelatococcus sp. TaxID=1953771 RepID=UPI001ED40947|nr:hypothetical protein [Chelatococcus sp.]MBX3547309.1 hypothetical protein [Chelatococcus sp.]CAH1677869.1 conserved hypothetical protein [Hyphomicrobiales bacterium]